jgi:outer membrane protein, heavy metal efflux system
MLVEPSSSRQDTRLSRWVVLIFVAFSWIAQADQHSDLTLDLAEARARAMDNNPGLAEMQERYVALTHVAPQKGSLPDPVVSLNAMNLPWDSFDLNEEPMTQIQLGVSQMLPFPGKLSLREEVALFEAQVAMHSVDEMRLNLDMNVTLTWWEVYFLDRSLETIRRNQALLRQFVTVAEKKYEVGKGLQQDVLLAQLELSKLLDQEIRIETMREHRAIRLNVLMDESPNVDILIPIVKPKQVKPLAKEAALYQLAITNRPALRQEEAAISASETRLALAKKDYYPDFKVGVAYGNRQEDELGRSRNDFLSIMFSINVPLYAGSKQSKAVEQRSRELAKSRYSFLDQKNLIFSSIASATADHKQATDQVTLFSEGIVPQAQQTVESMLAGYQVDQVDFLNLVRSQVTLLNYELQYWKAFTEVHQSEARLRAAVGTENIYE